jgi:hypothetical protein
MTREAAQSFMSRNSTGPGIHFGQNRLLVTWNRNKCLPASDSDMKKSRVIRIWGPADTISVASFANNFRRYINFDLVDSREWLSCFDKEMKIVELSLASIRGQSRVAFKCFLENSKGTDLEGKCRIWYALDPCEPRS